MEIIKFRIRNVIDSAVMGSGWSVIKSLVHSAGVIALHPEVICMLIQVDLLFNFCTHCKNYPFNVTFSCSGFKREKDLMGR